MGTTLAAAIIGGTASVASGGKFTNGARSAAFTYLLRTGVKAIQRSAALKRLRSAYITHVNGSKQDIERFEAAMVDLAVEGGPVGAELFQEAIDKGLKVRWRSSGPPQEVSGDLVLTSGSADFMDDATRERCISYGGNEYSSRRMDVIVIGHELSHALQDTTDPWQKIDFSYVPPYGTSTIKESYQIKHFKNGFGYFNRDSNPYGPGDAVYVENQIRAALGIDIRTSYHGVRIEGL